MDIRTTKSIAVKALRLQECYKDSKKRKEAVLKRFTSVWGVDMAEHFLSEYTTAEALIWAFDDRNMKLFIEKF